MKFGQSSPARMLLYLVARSPMSASELWQVKLPSGDILTVTLEQLDAAFEEGHVSETTMVREVGAVEWSTLAVVAGLAEAPPMVSPAPPKPSAPRVDPFVVPTPMIPIAPSSMAPLAYDAADDDAPFAPKRKPTTVVLGVCAACAAVILAALGVGAISGSSASAAAAPKAESHLAVAPPAAPAPPAPVAAPAPEAAQAPPRLTEAQKKAALVADKKLKSKATKKAAPPRKPAKDPFVKGGNKHDPLNKSL